MRCISLSSIVYVVATLVNPTHLAMAADSCQLTVPPLESAVLENHALFFFVFPPTFDTDYTGCQTVWDEKGIKAWSVRFDHGDPVEFNFGSWEGEPPLSCSYEDGNLTSGDSIRCPTYERLTRPVFAGPPDEDPPVPPERDPRTR
jgi:hypothetical protein